MKKCALKCKNAPGVHASVKCKGSTWKGGKGAKCPTKDPECECHDTKKPIVDHGFWDCYTNAKGEWVCDLICDEEKNGADPPLTPGGKPVQIKCNINCIYRYPWSYLTLNVQYYKLFFI